MFFNVQRTYVRLYLRRISELNLLEVPARFNMQKIYKRFNIVGGFVILLILLATNTIITRHLLDLQTVDQGWVSHAQQVLTQVAAIQSLIANAETGQRGYIYTGDPIFLGPYDLAVSQMDPSLEQLDQLTKDNPEEQIRIANLRKLVQTKMEMLSKTILLFQSGHQTDAKEMVASESGRLLLVSIDNVMRDMVHSESSLKGARSVTYQSSIHRTIASIYLASAIVAMGLLFVAYQILEETKLRDRRARARLAREKWFRPVLASLGHAVIATDKRGRVTFLNTKAEHLIGMPWSMAKGQLVEKIFPLFHELTLEPVDNSVKRFIKHGWPGQLEGGAFLKDQSGNLIPIKDSVTAIRDSQERLLGAVLVFQVVSSERRMQDNLSVPHDLGLSPAVLALTSLKIDAPLVAACDLIYIAKLNESISTDASDLLTLAEGHLERASHISREVLGFHRRATPAQQIDLRLLVDSVLRRFSIAFHRKNISIERHFDDCPSATGLYAELSQAISNLVSNAVDAVPIGGKIRLRISHRDSKRGSALVLSIHDNGIGIPPADRVRLFVPFFTTKADTGYGLGLWTAKGIVERHGGSIQVKYGGDNTATGVSFDILLPINAMTSFESVNS